MRIDLLIPALLLGAIACASPPSTDSNTPSGGAPSTPAPEPTPSPEPGGGAGGGDGGARAAAVPTSHPQYQRVEGTSFQNGCSADSKCFTGGCSSEVCSAEEGVSSTCEAPSAGWPSAGATCGCVDGQCIWYKGGSDPAGESGAGSESSSGPGAALPAQGSPCSGEGRCAKGLTCVTYYGIAGPRGPAMKSCEVRCGTGGTCPAGQSCTTVADGPGQVCRPGH